VRVVLDTNVLIYALITKGTPPDSLCRAWLRGEIEVVTSLAQLAEVAAVFARPRLRKYVDAEDAALMIENIDTRAIVLEALPDVGLSPDPADNLILAAAVAGKADLVVSGDKRHMLALGAVDGIPIVTVREALNRVGGGQHTDPRTAGGT
jgi:putative PIN family toxin of toxin-antitoxin system